MRIANAVAHLPGAKLIQQGLADVQAGRRTAAACLVQIGRTRLARAGFPPLAEKEDGVPAEIQLYRLLRSQGGDAYSRYNSLLRELVSFEQALDFELSRQPRRAADEGESKLEA